MSMRNSGVNTPYLSCRTLVSFTIKGTGTHVLGGPVKDICYRFLEPKTSFTEGTGTHKHPNNLNRCKLIYRYSVLILECKSSKQCYHKANISGQYVLNEFLDVVKYAATLFNSAQN